MNRSSRIYASFISFIGIAIGSYCAFTYISFIIGRANPRGELRQFGVLWVLYVVCRCFPIYIRDDYTIDMSFICNLATLLCKGPVVAAAMILVSAPFEIVRSNTDEKAWFHIFNTPPIKTTFNVGNSIIASSFGGLAFQFVGGQVGQLAFPGIILPTIAAGFIFFVLNGSMLLLLFSLMQKTPFFLPLFKTLKDFFPNIVASAPIGYFIAKFMIMDGGEYLVLLFMMPLMLARYSFVLYLIVKRNYYNMVKTLSAALEAKDRYTEGHSHRVEIYAERIARRMRLPSYAIEDLKVGALLHDVGKIGIDDKILNKPGPLTQEERETIMTHPRISANILKDVTLSGTTRTVILHHHERYDGSGYPDHTKGDEIPIEVYIVAVADAYDAMTSSRPYGNTLTREQAMRILKEESGKQFHPKTVEVFLQVLSEEEETKRTEGAS